MPVVATARRRRRGSGEAAHPFDRAEWPRIAAQVGLRIRQVREERGLNREEPAHLAGVHRNQVQNIENSRNNSQAAESGPST